jgi:hypothetical protein
MSRTAYAKSNETSRPNANEKDSDDLSFRTWRRRTVEQIMSRKDLSPIARLIAYSIAERLHQVTRSTPSSSMTLGRPVGLKPNEAQKGIDELVAESHARIKRRENGTRDLLLSERGDLVDVPYSPVLAPSAFFKTRAYPRYLTERAKFLGKVFADEFLTPADKVIAFGATRFLEVESRTIDQTFEAIGHVVGYGAAAVRRSVGRLVAAGYFSKDRAPGKRALLAPAMGDSATVKSRNADGTAVSSPISCTSGDSGISDSTYQEVILDSDSLYWARGNRTKTLDAACGSWPNILTHFGVSPHTVNGKHHACPACGGKDRFRFTDRHHDGDYFCSGCGPGKGISLVAKVNGWDYAEAASRVDEFIGNKARAAA